MSSSGSGAALLITGLTTYDPVDPAGEHPELTGRAFDGNPATTWNTRTYKNAAFGGLKPGVALIVTLSGSSTVHTVTLATTGTGGGAPSPKVDPAQPHGGETPWAGPPAVIADAFYRVRFGRTPLDNLQTQAVEQALGEIAAVHKKRRVGS